MQLEAVRKLSIRAETPGVPEASRSLDQLAQAQGRVVAISETETRATTTLDQARRRASMTLEVNTRQAAMFAAANDNLARSYEAVNDNVKQSNYSLHISGVEAAEAANHLKTAALAAYTLSPAFRQIANPIIVNTLKAIGPAAVSAGSTVVAALSPALAFLSRIAAPIFLAVEAWKALNAITELGEERLKAVADLQEKAFKDAGNLKPERKEVISTEEVAQANELNDRMNAATKLIEERWLPLKRDLVALGVSYNETWVQLLELIAKGVGLLQQAYEWAKRAADAVGRFVKVDGVSPTGPFGLPVPQFRFPGLEGTPAPVEAAPIDKARESLQKYMADQRLVQQQTLQTADAGRLFRKELEEQKKKIDDIGKGASEFDRLANSINRASAAQEADAQTVGKSVGEHARLRAEMRLREAAAQDGIAIDDKVAAKIKEVADRAGEATQALERARVRANIKFEQDTLFLSPQDRQIAQQLKGLYGDVTTSLNSAEAAQLRFINTLKDIKDVAGDFIKSFVSGLMNGKSAMQALGDAALSLGQKLANSAIDDLLSGNFIQAGVKGAAAALATIFGKSQADRAKREQEMQKRIEESNQRIADLQQRQAMAGFDTSTREGAIAAFNFQANQEEQRIGREGLLQFAPGGRMINPELDQFRLTRQAEGAALLKRFDDEDAARVKQHQDDLANIRKDFADREFAAANDNSTRLGRLLEFDRQTIREREKLEKDFAEALPEFDRARLAERAAIEKQFADAARERQRGFQDSLFALLQDQDTLAGQLAVFDLQARRQREEEAKTGGEAMADLEALLAQQRLGIIKDFNDKALDEQKRAAEEAANFFAQLRRNIREFIDGLRAGASSPLSPSARLASAQSQYSAQLALAQGGDRDALSGITRYASDLLEAAKGFFGSSTGFQTIFGQVTSQLEALPDLAQLADPIVAAIQETTDAVEAQTQVTQLIKQSNDATVIQVTATRNLIDASNGLQTTANSLSTSAVALATDQRNILAAIQSLQDISKRQLEILNYNLAATSLSVPQPQPFPGFPNPGVAPPPVVVSGNVISLLQKIVYNTQATAENVYLLATAGIDARRVTPNTGAIHGTLAGGGVIPPFGLALVSEHAPGGGRFLRAGPEPITVSPYAPANDNSGVVQELRRLREEVAQLRGELARNTQVTAAGAEHVREPLDDMRDSMAEQLREDKLKNQAA